MISIETKVCNKCGLEKRIDEFEFRKDRNKYRNTCKKCRNIYKKEYYKQHSDELLKKKRERYKNNPKYKEYRLKGDRNRKVARREYKRNRKKTDDLYRFELRVRKIIYKSLSRNNYSKKTVSYKILKCSYSDLISHLLKTYKNNYGYEWDGKEEVHIDHIIPLSTANSEEEIIVLCNYKNLQLLKEKDNLNKSNKIDWQIRE